MLKTSFNYFNSRKGSFFCSGGHQMLWSTCFIFFSFVSSSISFNVINSWWKWGGGAGKLGGGGCLAGWWVWFWLVNVMQDLKYCFLLSKAQPLLLRKPHAHSPVPHTTCPPILPGLRPNNSWGGEGAGQG